MRIFITGILSILIIACQSQNKELEYRSVEYYFDQVAELEYNELVKQKIIIDSLTIEEKYLDKGTKGFNKEGSKKYLDIKKNVYLTFFKDYLYQQHIVYNDNVYVLYFTVAGFDDAEWSIIKWDKEDWRNEEKLKRGMVETESSMTKIFWNYDEGPKNMENIKLFIKNDYLVFERGNLYHSLYDLKLDRLLINDESPWHSSGGEDKGKMNEWIKINLHNRVEQILNEERE